MQIFIAIALWCGFPSSNRSAASDVNQCRQQLTKCLSAAKDFVAQDKCFNEQKLP